MPQMMSSFRKAATAIRHPGKILLLAELVGDYISFRRRYPFLRQGAELADPAKKVLVVALNDWVTQVKLDGILAKALQVHGYTPTILIQGHGWSERYFRAFGFDNFVFFDELLRQVPKSVREEAEEQLREPLSFSNLYDLRYRGSYVGRHVLSTVVRNLRNGSIQFDDPEAVAMIRQLLPYSFQCVSAAETLLDQLQPQIALFSEKGYVGYGEVFDVAVGRGVESVQFPHSHRSDSLMLKKYTSESRHSHDFSLAEESWRRVKEMPWGGKHETAVLDELHGRYEDGTWFSRKFAQSGKVMKSADAVRDQLGLDPRKKTVVVFSHVLWDGTFFFGENLFDTYEQWLVETVRAACSIWTLNWVIKLHPDYVWKMKQVRDRSEPRDIVAISQALGALPDHIKILMPETDISTYSIFDVADCGITVRGTVGIELSCLGIPVITAGTGRYSGLGFTIDSPNREEYISKLRQLDQIQPLTLSEIELARRYAYAVLKLRPMEFQTFQAIEKPLENLGRGLEQDFLIRAKSLQDLIDAPDLKAFVDWTVNSRELDFMTTDPILVESRLT